MITLKIIYCFSRPVTTHNVWHDMSIFINRNTFHHLNVKIPDNSVGQGSAVKALRRIVVVLICYIISRFNHTFLE